MFATLFPFWNVSIMRNAWMSLSPAPVVRRTLAVIALLCLALPRWPLVDAQDAEPAPKMPVATFLTLDSPITDETLGGVRRAALELQNTARTEERDAYLVLELTPGISQFHHTYALADFLTSEPLSGVTTIAWVPKPIAGHNVLAALACNEIVMHPDATLGDLGRGQALTPDQQTIVKGIVARRRNKKVGEVLTQGMMDPGATVLQLTIDTGDGVKERRLVTDVEARRLREQGVVIVDSRTVKEAGVPGIISAAQARDLDTLAMRLANGRRELADAYGLPLESLRETPLGNGSSRVVYIQVKDEINEVLASFLRRQIDRLVATDTQMIIFEIDSPGGYLTSSRDLAFAIDALSEHDIRTVAYIPDKALSGATIVALGCDEIYLTPNGTIGDAAPIEVGEDGVFQRAEEKVLSFELTMMEELAERKNRPMAVLKAMADKDLAVYEVTHRGTGRVWYMSESEIHESGDEWQQGQQIPESKEGMLLTVRGSRAHDLKIAEPPVEDVDELKLRLGIPLDVALNRIEATWVDTLVFVLNNRVVTGMLFFIAIVCIYLELHMMTGLFGIIAVLSFAIFFWSRILGGTAGGLEIILFLIGLACIGLEIFVVPGFGVFGVTGILLLLGSLVMASQTFTGMNLNYDVQRAMQTIGTFGMSLLAVIITAMFISSYLPKIPFMRDMVLAPPGRSDVDERGPRLRPDATQAVDPLIGAEGVAMTVLRPAGKAKIDKRMVDVVSDGPFISEGARVEVISVSGNRVTVREV